MSLTPPPFEADIFINYSHRDNAVPFSNITGWVETLHYSLYLRLQQLFGTEPEIWRDARLEGHEGFANTILMKLQNTAFLLSVISPSYITSDWCKREIVEFFNRARVHGGIKNGNHSRIFKVIKTPIGNDPSKDPLAKSGLPEEIRSLLRESLGYEFYEIDRTSGRINEFDPNHGSEWQTKYILRLDDLAQSIMRFIKKQRTIRSVYLAEATPELSEARDDIRRMLQKRNFRVLPDESLPFESPAFEEKVTEYLEECSFSIHLIGSDHTDIPAEEERRSELDALHQIAAQRTSKQHKLAMSRGLLEPGYVRLLWIPKKIDAKGQEYEKFLKILSEDPAVHERGEVLSETLLEEFKTIVTKRLRTLQASDDLDSSHRSIYIYCDKADLERAEELRNYLETNFNYEVWIPFGRDDKTDAHSTRLRDCDGLILFYGETEDIDGKLTTLRNLPRLRNTPPVAKAIYVTGHETDQKRAFTSDDTLVVKNFGGISPDSLQPFLKDLRIEGKTIGVGVSR